MIQTNILQYLSSDKPLGFSRSGGYMRFVMYKLEVSQTDWYKTLDYAISRGWIVPTGENDTTGNIYDWKG